MLLIPGIIVLVIVGWLILTYNRLVSLRNQVPNAFRQIDVQLKRRHDLIPNLVNAIKGSMKFEQETLEKVIKARNAAVAVSGSTNLQEKAAKEGELTQALGRFFALSENYPDLKSNASVNSLMEELSHTENQVGFARQFYNDLVTSYNTAQQVFPTNLVAGSFGFTPAELFEIPDAQAAEREVPKVDLT